jgi:hypothetical protein
VEQDLLNSPNPCCASETSHSHKVKESGPRNARKKRKARKFRVFRGLSRISCSKFLDRRAALLGQLGAHLIRLEQQLPFLLRVIAAG